MGLNSTLSIATNALDLFAAGMQVTGGNVANASTPGYVREQLDLSTATPVRSGGLLIGGGVVGQGVRQQIDKYLEKRIYTANADAEGSQIRDSAYKQLEQALQEFGDADLSSGMTEFLSRINDVLNQPESAAIRQLAVQQGSQFAQTITDVRRRIDAIRTSFSGQVESLVLEANRLIDQIDTLNPQITSLEAGSGGRSDAGPLRNQRYTALNRLSEILPINTAEFENGQVNVYLGSEPLIIDGETHHLETVPTIDHQLGVNNVIIADSNISVTGTQGELSGAITGRDSVLGGFVDQLDDFASNLIFEFNKIHSAGQGVHGYTSLTGNYRVDDVTTGLDAAGLDFTPEHGSFQVKIINTSTGLAQTSTINVDLDGIGTNTTLTSLNTSLNTITHLTSTITTDRRLSLTADAGYEIQFMNDSSHVLAALGINTFFTGSDSANIDVNTAIRDDPSLFAAANGGGPGDGRNAAQLAAIIDTPVTALGNKTLDQYYESIVGSLAQSSASESALASGADSFRDSLLSQRTQFSGVSLDEEVMKLMDYQHSYQVAARFISTIDQLLTTLINV